MQGAGTPGAGTGQVDTDLVRDILSRLMSHLSVTDQYTPAQLSDTQAKTWTITYYVRDPSTGQRRRIREKVNHIRDRKARLEYARRRVADLNLKLATGWNPLVTRETARSTTSLREAVAAFITSKQRDQLEGDSMRSYRSLTAILVEWLERNGHGDLAVSAFSEGHARAFMQDSYLQRGLSNRTHNNYLTFYTTLFNWLKRERYTAGDPFAAVQRRKVTGASKRYRPPTESERELIRRDLEHHQPRFLTFVLLCYYCGIRPKEAFMLRPGNFLLQRQAIIIDAEAAKNDRTAGVAIPNVLLPYILALGVHEQHPDHYVFSTGFEPGPVLHTSRTSGRAWEHMRQRTGLAREVTMYQVKHAGAVALARAGLGAVDLMNHLRHHDLAMTTIYTKEVNMDGIREVVDKDVRF